MKLPYVFLSILTIILIFLIGFRLGQKVEKTNKMIDYILSITPYPTYTPYPTIKSISSSPTIKPTKRLKQ